MLILAQHQALANRSNNGLPEQRERVRGMVTRNTAPDSGSKPGKSLQKQQILSFRAPFDNCGVHPCADIVLS
jgi:hypothetical protein